MVAAFCACSEVWDINTVVVMVIKLHWEASMQNQGLGGVQAGEAEPPLMPVVSDCLRTSGSVFFLLFLYSIYLLDLYPAFLCQSGVKAAKNRD